MKGFKIVCLECGAETIATQGKTKIEHMDRSWYINRIEENGDVEIELQLLCGCEYEGMTYRCLKCGQEITDV